MLVVDPARALPATTIRFARASSTAWTQALDSIGVVTIPSCPNFRSTAPGVPRASTVGAPLTAPLIPTTDAARRTTIDMAREAPITPTEELYRLLGGSLGRPDCFF